MALVLLIAPRSIRQCESRDEQNRNGNKERARASAGNPTGS
jgi:hypothetical protein